MSEFRDEDTLTHSSWKRSYRIERTTGSRFALIHADGQKSFFDAANVCWQSLAENIAMWERLTEVQTC